MSHKKNWINVTLIGYDVENIKYFMQDGFCKFVSRKANRKENLFANRQYRIKSQNDLIQV